MADIAIFRINYKSDFILTLNSDAGWLTPFCIKFWTGAPSQAYFVGFDGTTYTHCAPVDGEPTKLMVQFDDHHLPIGDLKFQIGYHFTVADFPTSMEDEVINQASVIIEVDDAPAQVMLDFNGETAPEIQFSLPAYANEAQRIANEQQRIANEEQRIADEEARIAAETVRQQNEEQRINQETARVNEFARLKRESEAATDDANAAATLANEKAALAAAQAALAQAAATLANAKAQLAADKAALAQAAATLANDKAALAQQKATYAQTQGDYAKTQGDYAKAQGDTAQADHVRAEADHTTAADDHSRAEGDHTTAASDHTRAESDHTTAASDHTRAEGDHTTASSDHSRAEGDHTTAASDHTRAEGDHNTAASDHETAASDHTRAESDHAAVEVYVDSLGVFDLSKYNAVGGVLATYADLSAALTALNALDSKYKYGGMSFKFVQSSDHKYVQYYYMLEDATTNSKFKNVANWQKVGVNDAESNVSYLHNCNDSIIANTLSLCKIDGGIDSHGDYTNNIKMFLITLDGITSIDIETNSSNNYAFLSNYNVEEKTFEFADGYSGRVSASSGTVLSFSQFPADAKYFYIEAEFLYQGSFSKRTFRSFMLNNYDVLKSIPEHICDLNEQITSLSSEVEKVEEKTFSQELLVDGSSQISIVSPSSVLTKKVHLDIKSGVTYTFNISVVGILTSSLYIRLKKYDGTTLKSLDLSAGETSKTDSYISDVDYDSAYIDIKIQNNNISSLNINVSADTSIEKRTKRISDDKLNIVGPSDFSIVGYLNANGHVRISESATQRITEAKPLLYGADIVFTGLISDTSNYSAIGFFENASDTTAIGKVQNVGDVSTEHTVLSFDIPANAKYFRCCADSTYLQGENTKVCIKNTDLVKCIDNKYTIDDYPEGLVLPILANGKKAARIEPEGGSTVAGEEQVQLLWFSDIHGDSFCYKNMLDFASRYGDYIDDVYLSGDICNSEWSDTQMDVEKLTGYGSVLKAIGNHDVYNYQDVTDQIVPNNVKYHRYFGGWAHYQDNTLPMDISSWGVEQPTNPEGKCYYYKDYKNASDETILRLIVLDTLVMKQTGYWAPVYDTNQITWFESVLADALSNDIPVICSGHYPMHVKNDATSYVSFNTSFNSLDEDRFESAGHGVADDGLPFLNAVDSFIENGGSFITWLFGHTHIDSCGYYPLHKNQVYIVMAASGWYVPHQDGERVFDGVKTDLFNILSIDVTTQRLRIARFGAHYDRYYRYRGSMLIDYNGHTLLYSE